MNYMTAWLPGMDEPTEEAQQLVHKFEAEGGVVVEVDETSDSVRIELTNGKSFWISSNYLDKKQLH